MNKKIVVLNYRSICAKRAGGAEIYIYEIFKNLSTKFNIHFIVCGDKTCNNKLKNEEIICNSEFLFPIYFLFRGLKSTISADIIIENESKMPLIWPLLISKLLKKKFVLIIHHIHGFTLFKEMPLPVALILLLYELLSLKFYSFFNVKVVTVSTSTFYDLINLGFKENNIYLVSPGLLPHYFDHHRNIQKSSYPLVIYVGRLVKYKRLDHLVRACAIVKQKLPSLKCIIAGKGDPRTYSSLETLIKQLNLSDTVVLLGIISEYDKIKLLKSAWVYVFPTMKEGFGMSALEAQATGTPVVAYKVPGVTDSVKNGITGILVEDGNITELANAILKILQDEDLRYRLSVRAMLWARRFEWKVISKKFEEILNKIISDP
ncbi:MAG: glycosyltransferase family 4 protein [Pyrobaculum sp.]|jgi:glycosyltransferase involved in cell wall biosynthesis